jgi:hypothetical protein
VRALQFDGLLIHARSEVAASGRRPLMVAKTAHDWQGDGLTSSSILARSPKSRAWRNVLILDEPSSSALLITRSSSFLTIQQFENGNAYRQKKKL